MSHAVYFEKFRTTYVKSKTRRGRPKSPVSVGAMYESVQPIERLKMKVLTLGLLLMVAAESAVVVEWIPHTATAPLTLIQMLFLGAVFGSIGTLAGLAMFFVPDVQKMAQQAISNVCLAAIFGTTTAYVVAYFCKMESPNFIIVVPTHGLFGIAGSVIFAKIWPAILEAAAKKAAQSTKDAFGIVADDHRTPVEKG